MVVVEDDMLADRWTREWVIAWRRSQTRGERKKGELERRTFQKGGKQLEKKTSQRKRDKASLGKLRYGHIGCLCFQISFISFHFYFLFFLICHCWSWTSLVEDWTLLSLSSLHLLCFVLLFRFFVFSYKWVRYQIFLFILIFI